MPRERSFHGKIQTRDMAMLVLACAAAVTTALLLRNEFDTLASNPQVATPPSRLVDEDWLRVSSSGHAIGPDSAKVVVALFADYDCKECGLWWQLVREWQTRRPSDVRLQLHLFPMVEEHPLALVKAVAAKCAAREGQFEAYSSYAFRNNDTMGNADGLPSWSMPEGLARERFERCSREFQTRDDLARDVSIARSLQVSSVPTVWINGVSTRRLLSVEAVDSILALSRR